MRNHPISEIIGFTLVVAMIVKFVDSWSWDFISANSAQEIQSVLQYFSNNTIVIGVVFIALAIVVVISFADSYDAKNDGVNVQRKLAKLRAGENVTE